MTIVSPENKAPEALAQEKVDVNSSQQKPDTNLQQKPPETKQEDAAPEDPNWRAFREARKQDRALREAAEKKAQEKEAEALALKAAMEAAFAKTAPTQYVQYNDQSPSEETEDERINKKVEAALALREAQYNQQQQKREQQEYPQRLVKTYSDFNQTISQENLDYLDYHYPEVSSPLQRLPDGYDKWADIYRAVKKFVPNNQSAKKDAARADANFNKPKSMSSTSITQPGEAQGSARITEERRAANWERMQRILKGVS